jgi:hypothetical protein
LSTRHFAIQPGPAAAPRDRSGRFEAWLPLHELLDAVAEVAEHAAETLGCLPEAVSKGAWDRARLACGRIDLPTAEGVRNRLDRTWSEVLKMALGAPAGRVYRRGVLAAHPVFRGDDRLIIPALRWAGRWGGGIAGRRSRAGPAPPG